MAQSHNQYYKMRGTNLPATGSVLKNVAGHFSLGWGPSSGLPSAVAGWAVGALYITELGVYENTGSTASCTFSKTTSSANLVAQMRAATLSAADAIFKNSAGHFILAVAAELPSSAAGYAVGCLLIKTGDNAGAYVNIGTTTECLFFPATNSENLKTHLGGFQMAASASFIANSAGHYMFAVGAELPVTGGYAVGCIFFKTGDNAGAYVNKGTTSTADFKAITSAD
jgi:hypothetical protein